MIIKNTFWISALLITSTSVFAAQRPSQNLWSGSYRLVGGTSQTCSPDLELHLETAKTKTHDGCPGDVSVEVLVTNGSGGIVIGDFQRIGCAEREWSEGSLTREAISKSKLISVNPESQTVIYKYGYQNIWGRHWQTISALTSGSDGKVSWILNGVTCNYARD